MSAWRWRSSVIVPHNSTTPLRTMTSMRATGAHASFASSVNSRVRMASSLAVVGISSRATPASACTRLARVTMPTTSLPRTTGKRLMRRFSIVRTTSSSGVSSVTVNGSAVMMSFILRPWERVYSSASRPGPIKNSSQLGRRRCVPVSARRRKSPSLTIPTRRPSLSITGRPLMCRCSMIRTACHIEASGSTDTAGDVITSLAFMAGLYFGFSKPNPPIPSLFDLHQACCSERTRVPSSQSRVLGTWCCSYPASPSGTRAPRHHADPPARRRYERAHRSPDATSRIAALSSVLGGLSEGAHHILAGDDAHQLALGAGNGKAAGLQAHHQRENPRQRRRGFEVHDGFGHHFRHRAFHQVIVVRHHLTGGEGECSQKIEFGHDAQHLSFLHDGEGIEIMFLEQRFQLPQRNVAGHGHDAARHVLGCRGLEKSVHQSTGYHCLLYSWFAA